MRKETRDKLNLNRPEGGLFIADAKRLQQTIRSTTSWINHEKGGSAVSRPYTDRTKALTFAGVDFDRSDAAWELWEELCSRMNGWAPAGHYFDIIGEPEAQGFVWFGWVSDTRVS